MKIQDFTKVTGKKIKEMGAVLSDFLTVTNILEITKTVKFQVKDFINGLMVILTTVSGLMGRNTVMEFGKEIVLYLTIEGLLIRIYYLLKDTGFKKAKMLRVLVEINDQSAI